jgi:hypothetical protein
MKTVYQNKMEHMLKMYFKLFVVLMLLGAAGHALALIVALASKKIHRCPTWYSYCLSWITFAVSYSLLYVVNVITPEHSADEQLFTEWLIQAPWRPMTIHYVLLKPL